jgi:hypothetical protein
MCGAVEEERVNTVVVVLIDDRLGGYDIVNFGYGCDRERS